MNLFIFIILWGLIGFLIIFFLAGRDKSSENSSWVAMYAIGVFLWPIILLFTIPILCATFIIKLIQKIM